MRSGRSPPNSLFDVVRIWFQGPWVRSSNAESDGWSLTIATAARFEASYTFGPGEQTDAEENLPEILFLLAVDPEKTDVVVAGMVPIDTSTIELRIGDSSPITIERIFQRSELNRSAFVGLIPASVFEQDGPTAAEVAATGVDVLSVGWITHSTTSLDVALDVQYRGAL